MVHLVAKVISFGRSPVPAPRGHASNDQETWSGRGSRSEVRIDLYCDDFAIELGWRLAVDASGPAPGLSSPLISIPALPDVWVPIRADVNTST